MTCHKPTLPLLRGNTTLDWDFQNSGSSSFCHYTATGTILRTLLHIILGPSENCRIAGVNEWIHGSFNVCIPLYISKRDQQPEKQAIIRFPLPYKVGEARNPGNVNEKLRCEAATFIWIHENCPEIPIPNLWGLGLVGGQSFTKPQHCPAGSRFLWMIQRSFMWLLGYSLPCPYICHQRSTILESGYLVMDYVGNSDTQMLSETWDEHRHHQDKRKNLSKDFLALCSLSVECHYLLSNRPLTLRLHQLENGGIPTNISRDSTFSTAQAYYLDLLSCHDSRILNQPNSISDADDGRAQMARLTMMKALLPHFSDREHREGPFLYRLTDLHPSNIFVDSEWNVKFVIDLEWACSLPAETFRPPYWLTGRTVDDLTGEHLEPFREAYEEFVKIFEEEEKWFPVISTLNCYRTTLMRNGWKTGSFWYFHALESPKGLFNLFRQHVYPAFVPSRQVASDFSEVVSDFWAPNVEEVILAKLRDKAEYDNSVCQLFDDASGDARDGALKE
ncbi:hypothetical protein N7452_008478 [Penicillium brevicompactum]|uniref:Aminoglycoside phosphotransferase domain-containing protein n=1 Tax=Penicillium brevicompactum TaxID=5074 RepID=A0A9W9Q9Z4_PENBR|nr:hypothetical protein N7452_008478 [Penicillium brevicompactum]